MTGRQSKAKPNNFAVGQPLNHNPRKHKTAQSISQINTPQVIIWIGTVKNKFGFSLNEGPAGSMPTIRKSAALFNSPASLRFNPPGQTIRQKICKIQKPISWLQENTKQNNVETAIKIDFTAPPTSRNQTCWQRYSYIASRLSQTSDGGGGNRAQSSCAHILPGINQKGWLFSCCFFERCFD